MELPKREVKNLLFKEEARAKILAGATKMYEAVSGTYGPAGNNVILGMPFGDPVLTRDGVTVAKRTILKDKAEDNAASIIRQASERTNKTAGDGTTATVVMAYHLYQLGHKMIVAGENGMLLKKQIIDDSLKVIDFLKESAQDAKGYTLDVATVSAGDPGIGKLVAHTLRDVGNEGGITIREQSYPTLNVEKVNGYYFNKGFFALNQAVEYASPYIFVTQKQLASNSDIIPLLSRIIKSDNKNLVIIGDVRMNSEAMNTLMLNVMEGKLNAVVIPPPAYNDEGLLFMQDIAMYVGAKLFTAGQEMKDTDDTYLGSAEKVQVSQDKAVIFRGSGDTEAITDRAAELRESMEKQPDSHRKDQLQQRYSKLTGKIAIVNVGGSTPTEMEELRYRVEDAIEATKSAMNDGVLTGGGTMLIRASELDISPLYKQALMASFYKLMDNAGEDASYRCKQIQRAKPGYGFNLRDMTDEPVDLSKSGIWDAATSVIQTIENATSAAASLLTVGSIIDPIEEGGPKFNETK